MEQISQHRFWTKIKLVIIILGGIVALRFIGWHYPVRTGACQPTLLVGDRVWVNKLIYKIYPIKRGDLIMFDDPESTYTLGRSNQIKRVIAIPGDLIEGRLEEGKPAVYLNGTKCVEPYLNQFPLIRLKKEIGLIAAKRFWHITVPCCMRKASKYVLCSYDQTKSVDAQPFYTMTNEEVVQHPVTHTPQLSQPFTPSSAIDFDNAPFLCTVDIFGPCRVPEGHYWVMGDNRQHSRDSRYWGLLDEHYIRGRVSCILMSIDSHNPTWLFDVCKNPITFFKHHIRWPRFLKRV